VTESTTPPAAATTTQEKHPARSSFRTAFQVIVALATLIPAVVLEADIPVEGWVAQVVGVAVGVARVMAMPKVNDFLRRFAPMLAPDDAAPRG
jgi:hypothetical protein